MAGSLIGIKLLGDQRLIRQFAALEKKTAKKLLRPELRASAKRLLPQVVRRVPIDEGDYFEAIEGLKIRSGGRSRRVVRAGIDTSSLSKEMAILMGILEYGTKEREGPRGQVTAQPHWRPAVDESKARELVLIGRGLSKRIAMELRRTK